MRLEESLPARRASHAARPLHAERHRRLPDGCGHTHGLTPFGADVIRACNRLGIVCDVAHATEKTVKQAVKVSSKPLLLSHTALHGSKAQGPTPLGPRQISRDHARSR